MKATGPGAAPAPQRGVAIVLAMGVVALAALSATAILASQSTWSRHVELSAGHVQAQLLIQAGLDWARALLSDDRRVGIVDHAGEPWALRLAPVPIENGTLTGLIEDQQGKFNLNNLLTAGKINAAQLERFRRLLSILALPPVLGDTLAERLVVDASPWADISELGQLQGFDERVRARLHPFVAALPRATAVNANTASAEVLAALVEGLGLDDARALVAQRERSYFRNLADFAAQLPTGLAAPASGFSVGSDFFIATMQATIGGARASGTALLARQTGGWPTVVWRRNP